LDTTRIATVIAFVVLLIVIGPLLTIWCLNTLFPFLEIPYNLETYVAMVLLTSFIKSNFNVK
jgi:hypothetical protein